MQAVQDRVSGKQYEHLEIILKTVERCNLNCSYCYFFQGGDQSYKKNPSFISLETVAAIALFLAEGVKNLSVKTVHLNFHGGEPMLQKTDDFDAMCTLLRKALDPLIQLQLSLQTNGTIFTAEWIELFHKHQVIIGVSCDGPKEYHDLFRVDHQGRGSHEKVQENIKKFHEEAAKGLIKPVGVLCVIDPSREARKIYRHFREDLQVHTMDFLLPDYTQDTFFQDPLAYGRFLCDLFDVWTEEDNPSIEIRILERAVKHLTMNHNLLDQMSALERGYYEFTISSKGDLGSIDVLRSSASHWMWGGDSVTSTTLSDYLQSALVENLRHALQELPQKCQRCCWKNVCRGGYMINRYSKKADFTNPTVYCDGLKLFYAHVTRYLIQQGYPIEKLEQLLCL